MLQSVESRDLRVREARYAFLAQGIQPDSLFPVDTPVVKSWARCLNSGLDAATRSSELGLVAASVLRQAQERNAFLLSHARGVLNHLYEQIRSTGSVVILSDSAGMVLESLGDPDFVDRANRVALTPGALWDEALRGTNAIGTALAELQPIEIVGNEHYFDCNAFLTCSASPIFDAGGRLLGALDISGDYRAYQRHTLGLVRLTTQILEKRLFEAEFSREILVFFHNQMESVGTLQEGILAFSPSGELLAANRPAVAMLGLNRSLITKLDFSMVFDTAFGPFVDRSAHDPHSLTTLPLRHGNRVFARLRMPVTVATMGHGLGSGARPAAAPAGTGTAVAGKRAAPSNPEDATLDLLNTGDPRLAAAVQRAKRVVGRDIPLLILGESGVGKEMFAKAFHRSGPRRAAPFVALNCAAIPENLIESELFGYVGGAFTGARKEGYTGKIQQASGGTLFLDEIGDMPLNLQARLLRVLQERTVTPLGGIKSIPVDISLVCATHRNLQEAVRSGAFRQDLYYRVNGLTVTLPALRERSDIRGIVANIIAAETAGERPVRVAEEVLAFFERYAWPGNIRQLQNALRVAVALLDDDEDEITSAHLPEEMFDMDEIVAPVEQAAPAPSAPLRAAPAESLEEIERRAIDQVLEEVRGNVSAAARRLGISRNTLYRKLGRL